MRILSTLFLTFFSAVHTANCDLVIYESSTGNANGFPASSISNTQFLGSRFTLGSTQQVTGIGGAFATGVGGTLFGAIVEMDGPVPQGSPFDGSEVLGSVVFEPAGVGDDIAPLSISLGAGDYAVVFGSGLFGATGVNAMNTNGTNTTQGALSYFSWNGANWINNSASDGRFVVTGIPEPTTLGLMGGLLTLGLICLPARCRH